ncbi:aminoglycoside 6-adenylyltransferase [Ornithinibacillus contaminans]|uniref:aminoglycoside 6-adenylyltransferase n=1 Tax=Ornithinibacillus contaminans TaxID=694055 RepID=UPI00064DB6EC|nr:aminoglycoside 6-adenylyltransferase [Ornithinibacillus contaminans]
MRSTDVMMELILTVAEKDERVRAVGLNGSRTNPNVPKDRFQDFDIVYLVSEMDSFLRDPTWIDVFGERIILQTPEDMAMFPPELGKRFSYLMLFTDGNRIDLMLIPLEEKDIYCKEDKLTIILMDKDNSLPLVPPPTDRDYWVSRPSADYFADCCNEFWWVSTYVAKGLWRKEFLYATDHLNLYVRPMLIKMLEWQVGIQTNFSLSIGKNGKYLDQFLPEITWKRLLMTYPTGSYESVWAALFGMCELFRDTAKSVAKSLGYSYNTQDDQRVSSYLKAVESSIKEL